MNQDAALSRPPLTGGLRERAAPLASARRLPLDGAALGVLIALIYALARPPLYERDGYVYHLLGRDFLGGTNPHHLLWNGVQALITRFDALFGIQSVLPFQIVGMLFGVASALLLHNLLLRVSGRPTFAFAAALFVALAQWPWFMTFQNQPYAPMFLLFIVFLRCFAFSNGAMPTGARFALAAASAVGMVMLQQAAVLIVVGTALCLLLLGGARRAMLWAAATGAPTALLYVAFSALKGVRSASGFWQWITAYLHSQHSLQTRFPDSLSQSAMGIISAFVNQEPAKEWIVDHWSSATILWCYGLVGLASFLFVAIWTAGRLRVAQVDDRHRPVLWISVASIVSWGAFCLLWEPTNYYWFILLAPCFLFFAAAYRLTPARARMLAIGLSIATAWNLFANHALDAAGAQRAPEPQLRVIARYLRPDDLLWVVDLGWSDDIDYDLLSSTAASEHLASIRAVSDVVGASRDDAAWQRAVEDSTRDVLRRGGRVFLSDRVFDPDSFQQAWEQSPFADYQVERPYPINWPHLSRELPAFIERNYEIRPAGFLIGSDTIWRIEPSATHP